MRLLLETMCTTLSSIVLTVHLLGLCVCGDARADQYVQALESVKRAHGQYRAMTQADVVQARAELTEQAQVLEKTLDASDKYGQAWKSYLLWDRLRAQLAGDIQPDAAELSAILDRMSRDYSGLEKPAIQRVRAALARYYHRYLSCDQPDVRQDFDQRLNELAQLVESLRTAGDGETLEKLAGHLEWFERHEQIPQVVEAVRQLAPHPNVRVAVSQAFISGTTEEPIDRIDPLTDYVLGTTVHGTSHLVGTMATFPVSSEEGIRLRARLRGVAATCGRGYNGPVRAHLVGEATVRAMGEIFFGAEGFRAGETTAYVSASGRPTSMWTTCGSRVANGLITCLARRRAARTQELGDWIASRHAEQRLKVQVGEELQARLEELQKGYLTQFRHPLVRHQAFPSAFLTTSHAQGAQLDMLLATSYQLALPEKPSLAMPSAALSVQLHETAISNLAARMLAGRTVSEVQIRTFLERLWGSESEESSVDEPNLLYITFADERPLTVVVDDQTFTLRLRASHFVVNRRKYAPMNITVRYRLQRSAQGLSVRLAQDPEIVPPRFEVDGPGRLGTRETAARKLISNMLQRELATSYRMQQFTLPKPADVYGTMVVTQLVADDGWVTGGAERLAAPDSTR